MEWDVNNKKKVFYWLQSQQTPAPGADVLLQEDGSDLLLEDGSQIELETNS